jgi:magnesium transporter
MLSMERTRKLEIATASVRKFIQIGALQRAANLMRKFRAADVVEIVDGLGPQERLLVWKSLRALDARLAADVLAEMPERSATALLTGLDPGEVARVLRSLPVDDAAHLVGLLPDDLLEHLRDEEDVDSTISPELAGHLSYAEKTAGRLMTTDVLALPEDLTVGEATRALQERSDEYEMVFYLYVVDDRRHLVGVVSLRQLLLNVSAIPLRKIMSDDVISVRTEADQEEVAQTIARYNLLAVPVVDAENKLVGMITVDDAMDVLREEATEDIYALAGVASEESVTGSPTRAIRLRLPWLYINLATTIVPTFVVSLFDDTIKEAVIPLAALMPIVAGMGGNAGTQVFTVVIRGLALGEFAGTTTGRVLAKESLVGLGNGVGNGVVIAIAYAIYFHNPYVGVALGLAMVTNMFVAGAAGTLIPLLLRALKIDPAVASSVIVTTFTDAFGYGTFLAIATLFVAHLR